MNSTSSALISRNRWRRARFDEFLKRVERKIIVDDSASYDCVGVRWYGLGAFVRDRLMGMQIARKQQWVIKGGDVVYNKLFAWKGAFAIASSAVDSCIVSDKFPTYEINPDLMDSCFLGYYFRTNLISQQAQDLSKGAAAISKLTLNPPQFWDLTIPLPPLPEQRRIIARIEELAAKNEEARRLRQQANEEASALWERSIATTFEDLTRNYESKRFGDICEVVRGGSPRPAGSLVYYDGAIPFLKVADLTKDDSKYLTTYTASIKEAGLRKTRYVESNTLMLTNSGATLGVPKITTFATCFNDGIQAFLNLPDSTSKEYLYYFFRSKTYYFRDFIARGQGQPNLNTEMVKVMLVPVPPLPEQQRIVTYLDNLQAKVDALKELQEETAKELNALMPSILSKAFAGEL